MASVPANIINNNIVSRNDYPIIIVIVGTAVLFGTFFTGNEFAFFIIRPLSIVIIGVGAVLTVKRRDASGGNGLARYQRFILFCVAMLLLSFFAYALIVMIA